MSELRRVLLMLRFMAMHLGRCFAVVTPLVAASAAWSERWNAAAGYLLVGIAGTALWVALWLGDPEWSKSKP